METWKDGSDYCSWDGVTCDKVRGDVIGLDLSCSWLEGTIPSNSSLFLLHHLQRLNLAFNSFESLPISSRFGQFASSFMNLSSSLTSLALQDCQLRGTLPDVIFRLPNLRKLSLNDNFELKALFPMVNWTNPLRFLDVSHTLFSGELPKSIGNLKFLSYLGLSSCNFSGPIPSSLGNLTQLTALGLSNNHFIGEIPSSLSNLKELAYFDLHYNNLSGSIPASLGNLTKVTEFYLNYNNFTGQIPSSLSNLKDLTIIDFSNNNFGGTDFLTNLTKLTNVYLCYNQLTSQICEFQPGSSLESLLLDNNRLYGSIPKSISNLVNLIELDISSNNLSGSIPASIGNVTKVTQFFLQSNNLIGQIPSSLSNLKDLTLIDLNHNNFSDQLPWKNLQILDLRANLLQGKLPAPPYSIEIFLISNNSLIGGIPSMICNASSLRILDISRNRLGGTVPQCLGNFSNDLVVMDLRMNNFHGTIPDTFVKDNQLTTLVFNGNQLEGQLPKSLVNCTKLEVLDLGNNKISDFFPSWLEALPELKVLVLNSNRFHGPIGNHKTSGKSFSKLRILDLSHNEFTGLLPRNYFQNLNAMMTIQGSLTEEMERRAGRIIKDLGEEEVNAFKGAFRYIESDEYPLLY
uniref:Uncharacterized protein n=1 Tax=Fagus sylvatica TaxID=28930 RepID=A0A2N9EGF4_FAGSY